MRLNVVSFNSGGPHKIHWIKSRIFGDENRIIVSQVNNLRVLYHKLHSSSKLINGDGFPVRFWEPQYSSVKTYASNISGNHVNTDFSYNIFQQDLDAKNYKKQLECLKKKNFLTVPSANLTLHNFESRFANIRTKYILGNRKKKCQAARTYVTNPLCEDKSFLLQSKAPIDPVKLLEKSLREKLLVRPATVIYDHLAPTPSQLLKATLISYLPFIKSCSDMELQNKGKFSLPAGHHLVYFHQQVATSNLLPDGTDDLHSPGYPFERRLWVGGSIDFTRTITLFPKIQMICSEKITDVRVMGTQNDEKIFVDVTRQIINPYLDTLELKELRTLVFMRRKNSKEIVERKNSQKPRMKPYFSIIVRPTRELLFRFSALTFNSHRIHLDSNYCRQVEGLKSMIVQGPLTVVLMLAVLKEQLWRRARIDTFNYRNIAPLYIEEDMRICVKKGAKSNGTSTWHIWIEGPLGGYAVKGTATISWVGERANSTKKDNKVALTNNDLVNNQAVVMNKLKDQI
ncbi:Hydroxyacyl-thioester dehydratase type 2, mitochondrial [Erysiphe neolycopersici]|uniref:Hydroxyacyl-thioester dehydratase type 2, mitochondrial n=1 Tax=Erysiphe neolycopersici TaxID=212602 RepID=A0A420HTF3_9PEZI|nr:Hydroxyacyl-thioester dehydratase type 2, mitochondrial [Erysiphe neolycopersici]